MYLWQTRSSIDQSSLMLLNMPWCMEFLSTRLAMLLQSCWKSLRQECKAFLSSLSTGWKIRNVNSKMTWSEAMHGHHIHRSSRPWNMTVWHKFCAFCKCMYKKFIRIIPKSMCRLVSAPPVHSFHFLLFTIPATLHIATISTTSAWHRHGQKSIHIDHEYPQIVVSFFCSEELREAKHWADRFAHAMIDLR